MGARVNAVAALCATLPILAAAHAAAGTESAGDAARGERAFQKCFACHSVDPAERSLQGPNLHGVVGRRAASLPDFEYSPALLAAGRSGLIWTEESLARFLDDPQALVPGNTMGFFALADPTERADLIRYLKRSGRP